jgi:hypothetical protein
VVAALRQRRVRINPKRKPPGENRAVFICIEPGRYLLVIAVSTSDGSICVQLVVIEFERPNAAVCPVGAKYLGIR